MKTLYNIVKVIEAIADAHPQIEQYTYGDQIKIDDKQNMQYPHLHIESDASDIVLGNVTFNVALTLLDLPPNDDKIKLETESKAFDVLFDVVGEFKNGQTYLNESGYDFDVPDSLTISPIDSRPDYVDRLVGWQIILPVTVKYPFNGCSTNIINQESKAFSDAFDISFN